METSQSHSRVKALNQIPFSIGQNSIEVINFAPTSHRKSGKQVEQRTRPGKVLEILQIREKSRKMSSSTCSEKQFLLYLNHFLKILYLYLL